MEFKLEGSLWKTELMLPHLQSPIPVYIVPEDGQAPTAKQREILIVAASDINTVKSTVKSHALAYYRRVDAVVNFADEGRAIEANSIENHFRLQAILIPEIRNSHTRFYFVNFECDWEEERGMQCLIADGDIILCGECSTLPLSPQWKHAITIADKEQQVEYLKAMSVS